MSHSLFASRPHPGGFSSSLRPWVSLSLLALALLVLLTPCPLQAAAPHKVYITEVMSLNRRTVLDEDRHPSDWIELMNAGSESVNLAGWHLTDRKDELGKWTFPDTRLAPGEYLLVFASGKNRHTAGKELHTNFKLGTDGEYLALVEPDGQTIAMQFKPRIPRLRPDVSYGIPLREEMLRLIRYDDTKWVSVPSSDPGPSWMAPEFTPTGWDFGKGGVGFDGGTNLLPWIGSDIGPRMKGKSSSLLMRLPFVVANPEIDRLVLRMYYDDGFVAWLNGREVLRRNAPEKAAWNSAATRGRGTPVPVAWGEDFEGAEPAYVLMNGEQAARARVSASNPDTNHFVRLVNGRLPEQWNGIAFPQVTPEALSELLLDFDFRIKGGNPGENDLYLALIPTRDTGPRGIGLPLSSFRGRDVQSKGALVAQLEVSNTDRNSTLILHFDGERKLEIPVRDNSLGWRFYHHGTLRVAFGADGARISLKVQTDSRGTNGREIRIAENLLVPGVKPFASRLQVVGHTHSNLATLDIDNITGRWTPAGESLNEDVELTSFRGLLRPGTNVLAVLGLSTGPADTGFLILPELYGFNTHLDLASPRFFSPASPLAPNLDPGFSGVAPTPEFSPRGSLIQGPTTLTLRCAATNAVIRYTLDGHEPTDTSTVYTGPISLKGAAVVKAISFQPGKLPSAAAMETYTSLDSDLGDFTSNLPIIVINPQGRVRYENRKTQVSATVYDPGKGRASLTLEPQYNGRGDMNLRGFSSLRYPKHSYTFRLRDEYGEKQKAGLLGMPKDSDWVLLAPFPDKTLMRDALAYDLSRAMGHYAPRTRFVEVFLNNSGGGLSWNDYQGVYLLVEKIKRGKNRVDIHELGPGDNQEPEITGGYIFRRDHSNKESPAFYSTRGGEFFLVEPDSKDATPQQREWIEKRFHDLEQSIYGRNWMDPRKGYRNYLDVPSFIDQHWLIEMSKNIDGYRYSVYFSLDRGGKVKLEPVWDWNLSFGNANYMDGESTRGWYTEQLRESEIRWFYKLIQDPQFDAEQRERWWELRKGPLKTEAVLQRVDAMAAELNEAQARNFRRWQILGQWVHPNAFVGSSYAEEVDWMKKWIRHRLAWIDGQVPASSKGSSQGAGKK
ncbi:MAG TPA: hypothetical protein DCM86_09895 [Verrucomicrobiales bacterium]|nr:hypothetical protein [Verrucomicrobiales bacterium]